MSTVIDLPVAAEDALGSAATPRKKPQHARDKVASILGQLQPGEGIDMPSVREVARQANIPESTLRGWRERVVRLNLEPETIAFLESPAGVRFLHRLMVALFFVLGLMGGAGPSLLRLFLELSGLAPLVACSDTTIRTRMRELLGAVGEWGNRVQEELAKGMIKRGVSLGADETFFAQMVLVAMDVVSGYILLEKTSDKRDARTWFGHVQESLAGLNVELLQVVGDGASALRALAVDMLGLPKVDDLWHGQSAVTKTTAGPLAAQVQQATTALTEAREAQEEVDQDRASYEQKPRGPGRPLDWDTRQDRADQAVQAAERGLKQAVENQASMQQAVCDLGTTLHPVDLSTGALQDAATVETKLRSIFDQMKQIAQQAGLSARSLAGICKAARLVPSWVAAVTRWGQVVEARLADLALPIEVVELVRNVLIPVLYLSRVIQQTRDAARRDELRTVRSRLLEKLVQPGGLWRSLPLSLRCALVVLARDCVDLFQRSTGCVEGRNGYLSLHQHQMRGLGPALLKALTVVHNFVIKRADGTTAAVRFFGRPPDQALFNHLCQVLPLPARPRKRSRCPNEDAQLLAA